MCLLNNPGSNQSYAFPVCRIRITGYWASRSLVASHSRMLVTRLRESARHLVFLTVLFSMTSSSGRHAYGSGSGGCSGTQAWLGASKTSLSGRCATLQSQTWASMSPWAFVRASLELGEESLEKGDTSHDDSSTPPSDIPESNRLPSYI